MTKFLMLILPLLFSHYLSSQDVFFEAVHQKWENNQNYVLKMAELMPEEAYDFSSTPETDSFKKQLLHMMQNMVWLSNSYLGSPKFEHDIKTADPSKDEVINLLNKAFELARTALKMTETKDLSQKVDFFAGEKTLLQIIELMDDHLTHHKGQLAVYLRLNGITPPRFVGW